MHPLFGHRWSLTLLRLLPSLGTATLLSTLALASPRLPSASQWGPGILTWETRSSGHVVARAEGGANCWRRAQPVLEGDWEGQLLVGTVAVTCVLNGSCGATRRYPLFAFATGQPATLRFNVTRDPSCPSSLLKDEWSTVSPFTRPNHLVQARQLLERGELAAARRHFLESVRAHEEEAEAYYGLATSWSRARDRKRALLYLKAAVEAGFHERERMVQEFSPLLGREAPFLALVRKATDGRSETPARSRGGP